MKSSLSFLAFVVIFSYVFNYLGGIAFFIVELLPYVPTYQIHLAGYAYTWIYSLYLLPFLQKFQIVKYEDCFDNNTTEKIMFLAVPKSGCVLSIDFAAEMSRTCGMSVGIGWAESKDWPVPPTIPPSFEVDIYLAFDFWEEKFKTEKINCVVMTRDPLEKLVSMYKYTKDAGENALSPHSTVMRRMTTPRERFYYLWRALGRAELEFGQEYILKGIENGCKQIKADRFFKGGKEFDNAAEEVLTTFGMKEEAKPQMKKVWKVHDISAKKEKHSHSSGKTLEPGEEHEVRNIILSDKEVMKLIIKQKEELGY